MRDKKRHIHSRNIHSFAFFDDRSTFYYYACRYDIISMYQYQTRPYTAYYLQAVSSSTIHNRLYARGLFCRKPGDYVVEIT